MPHLRTADGLIHQHAMRAMTERSSESQLTGLAQIDDAYMGGERQGAHGRDLLNKFTLEDGPGDPFVDHDRGDDT